MVICSAYAIFKLFDIKISFQQILIAMNEVEKYLECENMVDYFNIKISYNYQYYIVNIVNFYNIYFVPIIDTFMNNLKMYQYKQRIY